MTDNTGGPAFPTYQSDHQGKAANTTFEPKGGLTLRDYFAAKALQGILVEDRARGLPNDVLADWAYVLADAMIEARMK